MGLSLASAQEVYTSTGRSTHAKRQHKQEGFDPSRLRFGGGFILGAGDITNLGISPIIGYRITDNWSAGIGIAYQYLKIKGYYELYDPHSGAYSDYPLQSNIFYPSVWTRYVIFRNLNFIGDIFVDAEFEYDMMRFKDYTYDNTYTNIISENTNVNVPCALVGLGIKQPITDRVSIVVMGLYDVLQQDYSPYKGTLDLRFGVNVGF
ncbi:MAG: hypothetical protein ACTHJ0_03195, partial [Flavipsychrobacter sp.]